MRRLLVVIVALLVVAVPTASASDIQVNILRVSATKAFIGFSGNADVLPTSMVVDWGTSLAYDETFTTSIGFSPIAFAFPFRDLQPGTTYHIRARLTGSAPAESTDTTFTTAARGGAILSAPAERLLSATPLVGVPGVFGTFTTCAGVPAQLQMGSDTVTRYRTYTFTNPTSTAGCATVKVDTDSSCSTVQVMAIAGAPTGSYADLIGGGGGVIDTEFQFPIAGNGTYSVLVADDGNCGAPYALTIYSTTLVPPSATTTAATAAGARSVTLRGSASANFVRGTTVRFEWGRTPLRGNVLPVSAIAADGSTHAIAARLGDLTPGVRYYARLVATGPGGQTAGPTVTFVTRKTQAPLSLKNSRLGVPASGRVSVPVVCPLTTTICKGKVVLRRTNKKRTSLGSKTFTILGGRTGTVRITLSTANRRLVKRVDVLRITATLTGVDGDVVAFPTAKRGARLIWRGVASAPLGDVR